MVNKSKKASSSTEQPTTLNPDMQAEILKMMQAQGVELDAEALRVLNQIAGKQFEETYKKLAAEKANEVEQQDDEKNENMEEK